MKQLATALCIILTIPLAIIAGIIAIALPYIALIVFAIGEFVWDLMKGKNNETCRPEQKEK